MSITVKTPNGTYQHFTPWMVQVLPSGWVAAQKGPDIRGQFMRIKEAKKFTEATHQLEVTE
jgi:hypothetical protein